jgi:hypothetical protein
MWVYPASHITDIVGNTVPGWRLCFECVGSGSLGDPRNRVRASNPTGWLDPRATRRFPVRGKLLVVDCQYIM